MAIYSVMFIGKVVAHGLNKPNDFGKHMILVELSDPQIATFKRLCSKCKMPGLISPLEKSHFRAGSSSNQIENGPFPHSYNVLYLHAEQVKNGMDISKLADFLVDQLYPSSLVVIQVQLGTYQMFSPVNKSGI